MPDNTDEIRTRKITLVDEEGRERAVFQATEEGALLAIGDRSGTQRVAIGVSADGVPTLRIGDRNGETRFTIFEQGDFISVGVFGASERIRCMMGVNEDGVPTLAMADSRGTPRFMINLIGGMETPSIILMDHDRNMRLFIQLQDDGTPSIKARDPEGNTLWTM